MKKQFKKIGSWLIKNDWFLPALNIGIGVGNGARAYMMEGNPVFHWSLAGFSIGVGIGLLLVIPIRRQVKESLAYLKETHEDLKEQMLEDKKYAKELKVNMDKYKNATDFENQN
jgi:hypothetical protein